MSSESQKEIAESAPPVAGGDDEISEADAAAIAAAVAEENPPFAKSLKCVECGKLFKNTDLASYHAEKSGHEKFEESTDEV